MYAETGMYNQCRLVKDVRYSFVTTLEYQYGLALFVSVWPFMCFKKSFSTKRHWMCNAHYL